MDDSALTIHFSPLLPEEVLIFLGAIAGLLMLLSLWHKSKGVLWRSLSAAAFLLILSGPSLLEEKRDYVADVAAIVVDQSPSQDAGDRKKRTEKALAYLTDKLKTKNNLDIRIVHAPKTSASSTKDTKLFSALNQALSDVPQSRRAGVIFLTDGQVHDIPEGSEALDNYGPIHTLLTGERGEKDRQLDIIEAPAYGIVDQTLTIRYRVTDTSNISGSARVTLRHNAGDAESFDVPLNTEQSIDFTITHGGQNIVELEVEALADELSTVNNKTALLVNGVRDRLKVLLVSGQPHAGGRTWRNLLTSDPGIDLVHFTILREPNKLDNTPQHELSLIAFPFRELFEIKLYDFDLIIFDRYRLNRILPKYYFTNIARYVREGGALLEASGPSFANEFSIYNTSLSSVLPARPNGQAQEQAYIPSVTNLGKNHPVTMDLRWGEKGWGPWLRQISVTPQSGDVIMSGIQEQPLLILDRIGEGRIAQLASDQIWLWSRGYEGGGPQVELLRRLAHWLMKEPELDENALSIIAQEDSLLIRRRSLREDTMPITLEKPDGTIETITLERAEGDGWLQTEIPADQIGVYRFADQTQTRFAIFGDIQAPEFTGMITTEKIMKPLSEHTKGAARWLEDDDSPDIRLLPPKRKYAGSGWLGLRKNSDYNVVGLKDKPLLPAWIALLILLSIITWTWWREGHSA